MLAFFIEKVYAIMYAWRYRQKSIELDKTYVFIKIACFICRLKTFVAASRLFIIKVRIMTTITVTNARKDLYRLLDQVQQSHEPIHITGKRGSGVLLSEEDFAAIQETLYLQSIPGMTESITEGMKTGTEECNEELDW
jgi:antitoxin YefM